MSVDLERDQLPMFDVPEQLPLFDGFEPAPGEVAKTELSADRRRTARQARDIARGVHPLTGGPLHERADATAKKSDPAGLDYRCGSCRFRVQKATPGGAYPKCGADDGARITGGPGTDVRAWWPACPSWEGMP